MSDDAITTDPTLYLQAENARLAEELGRTQKALERETAETLRLHKKLAEERAEVSRLQDEIYHWRMSK